MLKKMVVGTRGSKLALIQTERVINLLEKFYPYLKIEIKKIKTTGDTLKCCLADLKDTKFFTKELEYAIASGEIDAAVHSMKDVSVNLMEGTKIVAIPERVDPRDALISNGKKLVELPAGSKVGAESPRRKVLLKSLRSDLVACPIRGNIDTRIRKFELGKYDAIIVAIAGIIRLNMQHKVVEVLDEDIFLPPAGQGAIGVQIRADDYKTEEIFRKINNELLEKEIMAEREFIRELGGGCKTPVGVLARIIDNKIKIKAFTVTKDEKIKKDFIEGEIKDFKKLSVQLAHKLKVD